MNRKPHATFADLVERFDERADAETEEEFRRADTRARVAVWRYAVRLAKTHAERGRQRSTCSTARPRQDGGGPRGIPSPRPPPST